MKIPVVLTSLCAATALTFSACEEFPHSPTALGAMSGAGAGALIGSQRGHHALEGAAIGAAAGALIGHIIGHAREDGYYEGRRYPYGHAVGRGYVESPYYPHNIINVRGIPHGAVVEDPSTGGLFVKP